MRKAGLVVFVTATFIVFIWLIRSSSEWDSERVIENLELKGITFLSRDELISEYEKDIIGKKLDSLSLIQLEQNVKKHKYVSDAQAYVDGGRLLIEVSEKLPEAYLIQGSEVQYVDKHFNILPFRFIKGQTDLPVIRVRSDKELKLRKDDIAQLLQSLSDENGTLIKKMISEIYHGERVVELVLNQNGVKVLLDKNVDLNNQLRKFNLFWKNYISGHIEEEFKSIDLRWKNRIVVL